VTRPQWQRSPLKWVGTQVRHVGTALRNGNPKSMGHGLTLTYVRYFPTVTHACRKHTEDHLWVNG
jgi:hypothetical protein